MSDLFIASRSIPHPDDGSRKVIAAGQVERQAAACPFCARIAAGEYDYHNLNNVAFQPLNPVTPGHFLAVPKKHVTHALGSPSRAASALAFAASLANEMDLTDCNFITSAGPLATQTVFHLHVHVVPRRKGDGLTLPWTARVSVGDGGGEAAP